MEVYMVEVENGTSRWYQNDKLHRLDGPAAETSNGNKYWYKDGKRHREDGPAIEFANGLDHWYLNGTELSEAEFNARTKTEVTLDEIAEKFGISVDQLKIKK